jgi:pyruvate/2-oxoglutarate dehydrogenase complex dihydrolipoamide acyltransferase (E2) component
MVAFAAVAISATTAHAQNERALREALEGKTVTVKVDMPATSKGIDLFPEESMPINWRDVAQRLKDNGTSLKIGQTIMITKVVVNKDSHIEVQLGGGGYGTFGDNMGSSSSVSASDETESKLERQLKDSVKTAPTPAKKRQFEKDLANARSERERENARARAAAAAANEAREANLRVKRAESGSRFNVRYKHGIPADALTPNGVMQALAQYVDFAGATMSNSAIASARTATATATAAAPPSNALMSIKKGLSIAEVEALFGPANTASESKEGSLTVMKRTYNYDGKKITTQFVNGVMIDYAIAPQ